MNKRQKQKQQKILNKRFKNIDYSKIPYTNAVPNKTTLKAINGPFYMVRNDYPK